ncbi:hypothetical protein V2J09_014604 [Rumex salicifolius]
MEGENELRSRIEETVLEILASADMQEMTEHKVRKFASEKLSVDLSVPERKRFVRQVVENFLRDQHAKDDAAAEEEEEEDDKRRSDGKEYDDEGDLIICRLSSKRRVTITDFRGKTLVSIREYYYKDGKELPTSKGISLTAEQWAAFSKNVPAIEKAIEKMES